MTSDNDDIVREFLVESYENLDHLDQGLLALERNPATTDTLAGIFRTIHTIKGTCGFLGFTKLEALTHVGENLLSRLRDGQLAVTSEIVTVLLELGVTVRAMLSHIEAHGTEDEKDCSALISNLSRLYENKDSVTPKVSEVVPEGNINQASTKITEAGQEQHPEKIAIAIDNTLQDAHIQLQQSELQGKSTGEESSINSPATFQVQSDVSEAHQDQRVRSVSDTNIRVDVGLLDKLMNLVGELVLTRNQILQYTSTQEDSGFIATCQRLNLITTELQEGVMKTRMQPIGNIWSKFPRIVRELAHSCGKQVRIEMEGKETDLDKTLIEAIKDPLTHIVRNAVDHGIETPEKRINKGKPAEGCLLLRAFHEGGQVNIEISDDGAGIDPERVKQKAITKGVITSDQAARLSEREILNLIFLPGFSTAEQVTNVSGRGVGMDVVKTNIEKIGGSVDIVSTIGKGSTLKIKIPLTLAIIPALIVTSQKNHYAIPQVSLLELVRLEAGQAKSSIEMIHGTPVYRLRGALLPLVYLNQALQIGMSTESNTDAINIVVLQADDRQFGLVVDEINDTEEIVVKPLSKQLKGLSVFAGATIMGDGRVALILDVMGLAQSTGVITKGRERAAVEVKNQINADNRQRLLLIGVGDNGRVAIPLSMVARLEEIPRDAVERAAGQEVVQYRGHILPLAFLSNILRLYQSSRQGSQESLQVVVYSEEGRSLGLVVDSIIDIVEESVSMQHKMRAQGILGSAVIQQRVTDLLDVHGVIRSVDPAFFDRPVAASVGGVN